MSIIAYISSQQLMNECSKLKVINERAFVVHQLILAYKLNAKMKEITPRLATESELRLFHAEYYVNYLKQSEECVDDDHDVDDEQLEFGIGYDCPKLSNLWKFATTIAGGTLTAIESIYDGAKIAINWCGGWHHAQVSALHRAINEVANLIFQTYKPDMCVVQCGGDAIVGDPLGNTNLVPKDVGKCVDTILNWSLPTLFLGGGGYNTPNTSRYWTYLTSVICKTTISDDIPDDENDYFLMYGPDNELDIPTKSIMDLNTVEDFERNYNMIKENLLEYQVHDV